MRMRPMPETEQPRQDQMSQQVFPEASQLPVELEYQDSPNRFGLNLF
jgi:hypothetical protein